MNKKKAWKQIVTPAKFEYDKDFDLDYATNDDRVDVTRIDFNVKSTRNDG